MRYVVALLLFCVAGCGTETAVASRPAPAVSRAPLLTDAASVGGLISERLRSHKGVRVVRAMPAPRTVGFTLYQATPGSPIDADELDRSAPDGPGSRMIHMGGSVYTSVSVVPVKGVPPVAKPWTKWPASKVDGGVGVRLVDRMLNQVELSQLGPLAAAGVLTATTEETLASGPATHYTVAIDLARPKARLDYDRVFLNTYAEAAASEARAKKPGSAPGPEDVAAVKPGLNRLLRRSTVSMDLWVDHQGLPVKYVNTFHLPAGTVSTELAFSDWGRVPPIQPPPADEVNTVE